MNPVAVLKRQLQKRCLPYYIVDRDPFIFYAYWFDFYGRLEDFTRRFAGKKRVFGVFQFGWHYETEERQARLEREVKEALRRIPQLEVRFLANSPVEETGVRKLGFPVVYCHQNAFLEEGNYRLSLNDKEFDAVYVARITPFKRHELAAELDSLLLVGDYSGAEQAFALDALKKQKPAAVWKRYVPHRSIADEIGRARVGLCLSAEEGAMFVSAEYMLCGLPVVSTRNLGGRDGLLPEPYRLRPDDSAANVAKCVASLAAARFEPAQIRAAFLAAARPHREKLIALLNDIYVGCGRPAPVTPENFRRYCPHKLGLRCGFLPLLYLQGLCRSVGR